MPGCQEKTSLSVKIYRRSEGQQGWEGVVGDYMGKASDLKFVLQDLHGRVK